MGTSNRLNYFLEIDWAVSYTNYLSGRIPEQPPISNDSLINNTSQIRMDDSEPLNQNDIHPSKRIQKDFVMVNEQTWRFIHRIYGGGPEIVLVDELDVGDERASRPYVSLTP